MNFKIRKAVLNDREAIEKLIAQSARGLSRSDYSVRQIEAALETVFGVDSDLIVDGTYFVAESDELMVGCGGWSKRRTLFGGDRYKNRDSTRLDPETDPAKIRAFFIHSEFARKGIGRAILSACEAEARSEGFRSLELMSTLPGVRFYEACGYVGDGRVEYDVNGVRLEFVPMRKDLT